MRFVGAALTIGGIALAAFINAEIPDKTLLHLAVTGVAAVVAIIGIGIYEDAVADKQSKPATHITADGAEPFPPPHTAH